MAISLLESSFDSIGYDIGRTLPCTEANRRNFIAGIKDESLPSNNTGLESALCFSIKYTTKNDALMSFGSPGYDHNKWGSRSILTR